LKQDIIFKEPTVGSPRSHDNTPITEDCWREIDVIMAWTKSDISLMTENSVNQATTNMGWMNISG